jgi:hypothetical protein
MAGIMPGTEATIAGDIIANGAVIFAKGQRVVVQQVSPNAQQPEYRYLVQSTATGQWYQLRDADLVAAAPAQQGIQQYQQAAPIAAPAGAGPKGKRQPKAARASGGLSGKTWLVIAVIAIVVIGAAVGVGVVLTKKSPKAATTVPTVVDATPKTTPSGAAVANVPMTPFQSVVGGFSIDYPTGWSVEEKQQPNLIDELVKFKSPDQLTIVTVQMQKNWGTGTYEDFENQIIQSDKTIYSNLVLTNTTLDGNPARREDYSKSGVKSATIRTIKNHQAYLLIYADSSGLTPNNKAAQTIRIFNQMASTFKFL